jgi:hypothetical protein
MMLQISELQYGPIYSLLHDEATRRTIFRLKAEGSEVQKLESSDCTQNSEEYDMGTEQIIRATEQGLGWPANKLTVRTTAQQNKREDAAATMRNVGHASQWQPDGISSASIQVTDALQSGLIEPPIIDGNADLTAAVCFVCLDAVADAVLVGCWHGGLCAGKNIFAIPQNLFALIARNRLRAKRNLAFISPCTNNTVLSLSTWTSLVPGPGPAGFPHHNSVHKVHLTVIALSTYRLRGRDPWGAREGLGPVPAVPQGRVGGAADRGAIGTRGWKPGASGSL